MEWFNVLILIVIGLGLIIVEVIFVPGTTVVGILGFLLMVFGVYLSYEYFGFATGNIILATSAALSGGALIYAFRSNAWERFSLKKTSEGRVNDDFAIDLKEGDMGIALSDLKPIGKGEFDNVEYEVVTLGNYVSSGSEIRVIQIKSRKIIVEPIKK